MLDLVIQNLYAGGWLMVPIIICSALALSIAIFKWFDLRKSRIIPKKSVDLFLQLIDAETLSPQELTELRGQSSFGRLAAVALLNRDRDRHVIRTAIEDEGGRIVHKMNSYLAMLGIIASVAPLLGLLGTVVGMIKVFGVITTHGTGNAHLMAGGISQALMTTAAGLAVGIPALIFYHIYKNRISDLLVEMETRLSLLLNRVRK